MRLHSRSRRLTPVYLLMILAGTLIVTACGGSAPDDGSGAVPSAPEQAAEQEQTAEQVTEQPVAPPTEPTEEPAAAQPKEQAAEQPTEPTEEPEEQATEQATEVPDEALGPLGSVVPASIVDIRVRPHLQAGEEIKSDVIVGPPWIDDTATIVGVLHAVDSGGSPRGFELLVVTASGTTRTPLADAWWEGEPVKPSWMGDRVEAVFFADVDGDATLEVIVLATYVTGIGASGAQPFFSNDVMDWVESALVPLEPFWIFTGPWAARLAEAETEDSARTLLRDFAEAAPENPPGRVLAPAAAFKPSLEERYEVSVEEALVYGTGGTFDGGQIELLLDLAVPDTGDDGLRPLLVQIHGGGFTGGSRWPQRDWAARGWVAASIDYRLAGDDPLPGPRVQRFFDAVGGESASAVYRSAIAAVEDTLVALDYLLGRADELHIDTDRIVLKGYSAGAFTALHVAYCADEFGISRPTIAAVIDYAGAIAQTCGEGAAIDSGEAALFIVHGTADTGETSFTRAENIAAGAESAGITYEFHPLEGVGHNWNRVEQTAADGRKIGDLMYEFLDRVLYG